MSNTISSCSLFQVYERIESVRKDERIRQLEFELEQMKLAQQATSNQRCETSAWPQPPKVVAPTAWPKPSAFLAPKPWPQAPISLAPKVPKIFDDRHLPIYDNHEDDFSFDGEKVMDGLGLGLNSNDDSDLDDQHEREAAFGDEISVVIHFDQNEEDAVSEADSSVYVDSQSVVDGDLDDVVESEYNADNSDAVSEGDVVDVVESESNDDENDVDSDDYVEIIYVERSSSDSDENDEDDDDEEEERSGTESVDDAGSYIQRPIYRGRYDSAIRDFESEDDVSDYYDEEDDSDDDDSNGEGDDEDDSGDNEQESDDDVEPQPVSL